MRDILGTLHPDVARPPRRPPQARVDANAWNKRHTIGARVRFRGKFDVTTTRAIVGTRGCSIVLKNAGLVPLSRVTA